MKIDASISTPLRSAGIALLLALTACDSNDGPGPGIHDSKYVGVDDEGAQLAAGIPGACVLDQFTGLLWEVKGPEPGLRYFGNTYSWFDPDEDAGGDLDYRGTEGAGSCEGSRCDTRGYVDAVNAAGLCGHQDWRVPSRDELGSISDPRKNDTPPTINTLYFPYTQPDEYWSANDYQFHWDTAWLWNFGNGLDRVEWKASPRYLRLVRGDAVYLQRVED